MQKWDIVTSSIIGKSHESSKLPNQDSLAIFPENMVSGTPIIATISDGHGAERYHRSHLVSSGNEAKVVIEANKKTDYRDKLAEELKELHESEMWQAGAQVRKLRPERQS